MYQEHQPPPPPNKKKQQQQRGERMCPHPESVTGQYFDALYFSRKNCSVFIFAYNMWVKPCGILKYKNKTSDDLYIKS